MKRELLALLCLFMTGSIYAGSWDYLETEDFFNTPSPSQSLYKQEIVASRTYSGPIRFAFGSGDEDEDGFEEGGSEENLEEYVDQAPLGDENLAFLSLILAYISFVAIRSRRGRQQEHKEVEYK